MRRSIFFHAVILFVCLFAIYGFQEAQTVIDKPDLPPYPAALQVLFGVLVSFLAEFLTKERNPLVSLLIVGGLSIVGGIAATVLAVGFNFGAPEDVIKFLFGIFIYSQTTFGILNAVNKARRIA